MSKRNVAVAALPTLPSSSTTTTSSTLLLLLLLLLLVVVSRDGHRLLLLSGDGTSFSSSLHSVGMATSIDNVGAESLGTRRSSSNSPRENIGSNRRRRSSRRKVVCNAFYAPSYKLSIDEWLKQWQDPPLRGSNVDDDAAAADAKGARMNSKTLCDPYFTPPNTKADTENRPVQVFILLGQPNMLGMGRVRERDGPRNDDGMTSLEYTVLHDERYGHLLASSSPPFPSDASATATTPSSPSVNWAIRHDIRNVGIMGESANPKITKNEWLTVNGTRFGPELQFGYVVAELAASGTARSGGTYSRRLSPNPSIMAGIGTHRMEVTPKVADRPQRRQ